MDENKELRAAGGGNAPADGTLPAAETPPPVGAAEIARAAETLRRYAAAKAPLTQRLIADERWWDACRGAAAESGRPGDRGCPGEPTREKLPSRSAWLFNTILNKHADMMDNYPEPVVLPRERGDEPAAAALSAVLPVVLEQCGFEQTYSDLAWEKLKHGTAVWGVFWDGTKENGLGDVDVRAIDLRSVFWEPGITDVQRSRSLFLTELADVDALEAAYPAFAGRFAAPGSVWPAGAGEGETPADPAEKRLVVHWYYRRRDARGRTRLHYVKFSGDCLLYASENDPACAARGFYDHGMYPVVFDTLFPIRGSAAGFGYVAVTKNPQMFIDRLSENILESSLMAAKKRFFVSTSTNVDPVRFADWEQQLVPVEGEISDARIQEIRVDPVPGVCMEVLREKIDEMKDTAGNRDVNSGRSGSGVTAAAAIVALQEAGNKTARDLIGASYRAHAAVMARIIELMRQFYDAPRTFRVTGAAGYADFRAEALRARPVGVGAGGETLLRAPVFDLKIKAQKRNPFSRMELNERAKELYQLGFFDPARAEQALMALEIMDFEGVEAVRERIRRAAERFAQAQGGAP